LPSDDVVSSGFYARLKTALEGRDEVGAAYCRNAFIDEKDRPLWTSELESATAGILPGFIEKIGVSSRIQCPTAVVRRSVYQQLGGFRLDLPQAADWEMWIRIAAHFPIWYEPTTLGAYRIHSKSATTALKSSGETFADVRRCIEVSRACLPPDRAETISRRAKEWVCLWELSEAPEAEKVLRLVDELSQLSGADPMDRIRVAHAFLRAANIHRRQGRNLQFVVFVARAIRTHPGILGDIFWDIFINRTFPLRKRLGLRRRRSIERDAQRV
jgi:hypothetical protein